MKRVILLSLLLITHYYGYGQDLISDKTKLKAGIYRSFEEFKYNNPSIEFDYPIRTKERGYGFLNSAGSVVFYKIDMKRKETRTIGEVFGFCDGRNVYINEYNPDLQRNTEFAKVEFYGEYCYFEGVSYSVMYGGPGAAPTTTSNREEKIISINTGKVTILSKSKIRQILARDPELLAEFNKEKKKRKKLKKYLIKFLEKHHLS